MATVTRADVVSVLGPVDDTLIAEIMLTGASRTELAEAHAWLVSDEALVNQGRALPSGRVGSLIEILEEHDEPEEAF